MDKTDDQRAAESSRLAARPLDATDYAILALLQEDSNRTDVDLARKVSLSASGLKKRLRKLERRGVIQQRVTLLDRNAVDLGLLCFVQVYLTHHQADARQQFSDAVRKLPEVLECHFLTGEHDYMLKIVARDYRHLEHILADHLAGIPGVDRLLTSIVLNEIKRTTALPLSAPREGGESAS
jgi:DNA-binding Lrp family transcriptional regulator